jgi:hypothetical protein
MILLIISNVSALTLAGFLAWLLRDALKSARERENELLTWIKDTPTAVVSSMKRPGPKLEGAMDPDEEMEEEYADEETTPAA